METAGLAIGVGGLAGLFSSCIDCYQLIQRGRSFERDYRILQTKFDNQELRLYSWGAACGLTGAGYYHTYLDASEVQAQISATLHCIKDLFQDQTELKKRYGLKLAKQYPRSQRDGIISAHTSPPAQNLYIRPRLGTFFRRKKQQCSLGIPQAALWVIDDYRKFSELIQHLRDFNDDLEAITRLTNIALRQEVVVEYEVEEIDDPQTLEDIRIAGADVSDIVSDAASMRLASLREGSVRTTNSSATRDSVSFQTANSYIPTRPGSVKSIISISSTSFQTTRSMPATPGDSIRSSAVTGTEDSVSFHSICSRLSIQERLSLEFEHDELCALGITLDHDQQQEGQRRLTDSPSSPEILNVTAHVPFGRSDVTNEVTAEATPAVISMLQWPGSQDTKSSKGSNADAIPQFKVLAVGPNGCGSTNLLTVFTLGYWPTIHRPTIFKDYVTECRIDGLHIKLLLVDTAGQEAYPRLRTLSYADTHAMLICVNASQTLADARVALEDYLLEAQGICPNATKFLVAIHDPIVDITEESRHLKDKVTWDNYAENIGAHAYFWCDPQSREGVDGLFEQISRAMVKKHVRKRSRLSSIFRGLDTIGEDLESQRRLLQDGLCSKHPL